MGYNSNSRSPIWQRRLEIARSVAGNSFGGVRGGTNVASWIVAGTLAYFLWIKPAQQLKQEQAEKSAMAATDPYRYVEKRKPMPDPQDTGLIYGKKNRSFKSE